MNKLLNNKDSIFYIIKMSFLLLFKKRKRESVVLFFLIFLCAVIDVMSFTSIIPVIYLINNPAPIEQNKMLHVLYMHFNFHNYSSFILFLLVLIVSFFTLKNCILFYTTYFQNKFIFSVASDVFQQQMKRFFNSEYLDIKNHNSQEYLRYIAIAPQEFAANILLPLFSMLYEVIVIFLIVIALFYYYPLILLLTFIAIVPVCLMLILLTKKKLSSISDTKGKLELDSFKHAYEGISGYTDIKLFSKEDTFINSISDKFNKLYDIKVSENIYQWFPRRIIETMVIVSVCILFAITSLLLEFSTSQLVLILIAFATAAYRLMPSVNEILVYMVKIKTSNYVINHLSFFKTKVTTDTEPFVFEKQLVLNNIKYRYHYDGSYILDDITLHVDKNDFIVIIGESGSGKTTIGKIISGFVQQKSGAYLIDGKEVKNFNEIKHLIAYVTQDFYLFDKSLLENIAIGEKKEEVNLERVNNAIEAANLTEFVQSLPIGIDYVIGEMGARLSGGQRQRIAIARALYKKAQILVLDEITSALDKENEVEILDAIYTIAKNENLTVFLITHRIASLKKYDKLYLLEKGKLTMQ